jgi:hypothetical protein
MLVLVLAHETVKILRQGMIDAQLGGIERQ